MAPFNNLPNEIDQNAAVRVNDYLEDMTPGNNCLESDGHITDNDMLRTKEAAIHLANLVANLGKAVVVAHSQGNLLANLAYARLASTYGNDILKMIRVVNVANTSLLSINNLNFTLTHAGDAALFSAATSAWAFFGDQSLETMPTRTIPGQIGATMCERTTPMCWDNSACNFTLASATFGNPTSAIPDQGLLDPDHYLHHSITDTYLSTATVPVINNQGITFTAGANRFVDRFEDIVYAAAASFVEHCHVPTFWRRSYSYYHQETVNVYTYLDQYRDVYGVLSSFGTETRDVYGRLLSISPQCGVHSDVVPQTVICRLSVGVCMPHHLGEIGFTLPCEINLPSCL